MGNKNTTLSIITATYNAEDDLPRLINSLKRQSDQEFEWVVADGNSEDQTLELLKDAARTLRHVKVDSKVDFGIYDALNRALTLALGEYYIVVGADDVLSMDAVEKYKKACEASNADIVTARIKSGEYMRGIRSPRWPWLYGPFAYVSCHAVGIAIRRSLHEKLGYYSRWHPITADQLFILKAVQSGATISEHDFIAGCFTPGGVSGRDVLGALVEGYRVQVEMGGSIIGQLALLCLRILKNYNRIRASLK